MRRIWTAILLLMGFATTSFAHYSMLLPDKAWANKGDKVTFTYQFGHPYEHELFDAPEPGAAIIRLPDDETRKLEKFTKTSVPGPDGKKVAAWTYAFQPEMRGDYTMILQTRPIWMEDTKTFVQDTVKAVVHVQAQKNWQANFELDDSNLKIVPLTRPYGLLPGMVFQAQLGSRSPLGKFAVYEYAQIEVERYNPTPPKKLPPDELITFKTRTDAWGTFTFAFPEPGWWGMTAGWQEKDRTWKAGGKEGPLHERTTLWIHVDEKK